MLEIYMGTESTETNLLKKNLSSTSKHREVPEPKLAGAWEKVHDSSIALCPCHLCNSFPAIPLGQTDLPFTLILTERQHTSHKPI